MFILFNCLNKSDEGVSYGTLQTILMALLCSLHILSNPFQLSFPISADNSQFLIKCKNYKIIHDWKKVKFDDFSMTDQ